jgi:uncharacterized protein DUF397
MTAPDLSQCVWRKSSGSGSESNCVEVAWSPESLTAVRDSKCADGPVLTFPVGAWVAFLRA